MRVGFVHGVMNTDNMSILGLTIDYGPYGWIDNNDLDWTPNVTDVQSRRYRFGAQPQVAYWNLGCLARALAPLFSDAASLQAGLERFRATYLAAERRDAAAKLGFAACFDEDLALFDALRTCMHQAEMDMTLTFLGLADWEPNMLDSLSLWADAFYDPVKRDAQAPMLRDWLQRYAARLSVDPLPVAERHERMRLANPRYVLRNYLTQQAIECAEQGDLTELHALLEVMRRPYDFQLGREAYGMRRQSGRAAALVVRCCLAVLEWRQCQVFDSHSVWLCQE